jgi:IPT/TIG domain
MYRFLVTLLALINSGLAASIPSRLVRAISEVRRHPVVLLALLLAACAAFTRDPSPPSQNPSPSITSINPPNTIVGGQSFTLTVSGSNFTSSSTVDWNGIALPTRFQSATSLQATVPASDIAAAGTVGMTVVNPAPGGKTSNMAKFQILTQNSVPSITSINPPSTIVGGQSFTLTVTGSNFTSSSKVDWNGTVLPTAFQSATSLQATVPASDIAAAGTVSMTVVNPVPGGETSNVARFQILTQNSNASWTVTMGIPVGISPTATHSPGSAGGAIPFRRSWGSLVYVGTQSKVLWYAGGPDCCSGTLQNSLFWFDDTQNDGTVNPNAWSLAWAAMLNENSGGPQSISSCTRESNVVTCTLSGAPPGGPAQMADFYPTITPFGGSATVTPMTVAVWGPAAATTGSHGTTFAYVGPICLPPTNGCIYPTQSSPWQFSYQQAASNDTLIGVTAGTDCGSASTTETCFGGPSSIKDLPMPKHPYAQWTYDNTNQRVWSYGGSSQGTINGGSNGKRPYCSDCSTGELFYWSTPPGSAGANPDPIEVCGGQITCSGTPPPPLQEGAAVWDDCNNQLIVAGGANSGGMQNNSWEFNPATSTWTQQSNIWPNGPHTRGKLVWVHAQCAAYWFFGGLNANAPVSDIFKGTATAGNITWTQLTVIGATPNPSLFPVVDMDPYLGSEGKIIYITQDQPAQVWEFDPSAYESSASGAPWLGVSIPGGPTLHSNPSGGNGTGVPDNMGAFNIATNTFDLIISGANSPSEVVVATLAMK